MAPLPRAPPPDPPGVPPEPPALPKPPSVPPSSPAQPAVPPSPREPPWPPPDSPLPPAPPSPSQPPPPSPFLPRSPETPPSPTPPPLPPLVPGAVLLAFPAVRLRLRVALFPPALADDGEVAPAALAVVRTAVADGAGVEPSAVELAASIDRGHGDSIGGDRRRFRLLQSTRLNASAATIFATIRAANTSAAVRIERSVETNLNGIVAAIATAGMQPTAPPE
eukprot:4283704-Prymnesium_polylepis.2